ncbi:hypothetical protein GCM10010297_67350 [Streptomyces malachitofuscus]|nr:hypothetical protein GCM10010297_67350 [Streptomyces malachitofuscus]
MSMRTSAVMATTTAVLAGTLALMPAAGASAATGPATSGGVGDVTAAAARNPGGIYRTSNGWCHFTNWGGSFYCYPKVLHAVGWNKPDGHPQVFVIGTDKSVWTRWSSASGTSGWKDYGGTCRPEYGLDARSSGWTIKVACVGTDHSWWHRKRNANGKWTNWTKGRGF